jgi:hypothetical protein
VRGITALAPGLGSERDGMWRRLSRAHPVKMAFDVSHNEIQTRYLEFHSFDATLDPMSF